jgi:cytochrome b6-f complex iron-sulfur subunit
VLGVAQSTFAVAIVVALFALFVLLLLGSFARARRSTRELAATGESAGAAPRVGGGRPAAPGPAPGGGGGPRVRPVISRRDFFRGGLLASLLAFGAEFGGATLAFLWPNLKGGFGSLITLPDTLDSIKGQIEQGRQPYYFGAGRFYLINYNGDGDKSGGIYDGITADSLMALYQKCAHLGCRVPFCQQSQWFECPCHGSKYNYAGEYQLGPAPTGLMRFAVKVSGNNVQVDTSTIIPGPPRGTNTIHQAPEGPFCVGGAAGG